MEPLTFHKTPYTAEAMDTIDLRDLITQFTQHPISTTIDVLGMMGHNLWENWARILVLLVSFYVARHVLFRVIDSMVPNPKNPKKGHLLRRFFLRKVTDKEGRLQKRFTGGWWGDANSRFRDRESAYYSRRTERAAGLASLMKSILNLTFGLTLVLVVLAQLGITTSSQTNGWLMGAIGVALAFGAQNVIKDILAGLHVLAEDQYGLGDYIDAQFGVAGTVTHIGLRTTRLKGADGTIYHVRHSEMPKVGNRTQATGNLILDIELKWNNLPEEQHMVQAEELKFAEDTLTTTIRDLRSVLNAVDRVATSTPAPTEEVVPLNRVAEVVPTLVPQLSADTLTNLTAIANDDEPDSEDEQNHARKQIVNAINRHGTDTPLFQDIEMLGLVNSEADSLTLRVKIKIVSPGSRPYALSLLRRRVFEDFAPHDISAKFEEVPEGTIFV